LKGCDARQYKSSVDRRKLTQDLHSAPVSYDLNSNLYGLLLVQIASPADFILLALLMSEPSARQFVSTAWKPGLPSPLSQQSNRAANASDMDRRETRIPVIFADLHTASVLMDEFQSEKANPDTSSLIEDLRWNIPRSDLPAP